jgi:branched-subunit amino acid ABC-type transport system permease component
MDLSAFISILFNGVFVGSIYSLLAVSLTISYGVAKTVNLALGELMLLGAYLTYWLCALLGVPPLFSLIIVPILLMGLALMLFLGGFSTVLNRRTHRKTKESMTLLLTFGVSLIISNGIAGFYTPDPKGYSYLTATIEFIGVKIMLNKALTIILSFTLIMVLLLITKRTWSGKALKYVLDNEPLAELVGVNLKKVYLLCFLMAFAIAGISGVLFSLVYVMTPYMGTVFTMTSFVIIIFGGIGSIKGAVVVGMLLGIATSFITYFTSPLLDIPIIFSILIITLMFKPEGLFKI